MLYSPNMYPKSQLLFEARRNSDLKAEFYGFDAEQKRVFMHRLFNTQSGIFYTFSPSSRGSLDRAEERYQLRISAARSIFYYKLATEVNQPGSVLIDRSIETTRGSIKVNSVSLDELEAAKASKERLFRGMLQSDIRTPIFDILLERYLLLQQEFLYLAINSTMLNDADDTMTFENSEILGGLLRSEASWWISQYERFGLELPEDFIAQMEFHRKDVVGNDRAKSIQKYDETVRKVLVGDILDSFVKMEADIAYRLRHIFKSPAFTKELESTKLRILSSLEELGYSEDMSYIDAYLEFYPNVNDKLRIIVAEHLAGYRASYMTLEECIQGMVYMIQEALDELKDTISIEESSPHPEEFTIGPKRK